MKKVALFISLVLVFSIFSCSKTDNYNRGKTSKDYLYFYVEDNNLGFLKYEGNKLNTAISPQFDKNYLKVRNQKYEEDYWYINANKELIPIQLQNKWGYIKKKNGGIFEIPPIYDYARNF